MSIVVYKYTVTLVGLGVSGRQNNRSSVWEDPGSDGDQCRYVRVRSLALSIHVGVFSGGSAELLPVDEILCPACLQ